MYKITTNYLVSPFFYAITCAYTKIQTSECFEQSFIRLNLQQRLNDNEKF